MSVEVFFAPPPCYIMRVTGPHNTVREATGTGCVIFWFLFCAYDLSIGTVLGFVKSHGRAGVA
jgi:hypothetical protein